MQRGDAEEDKYGVEPFPDGQLCLHLASGVTFHTWLNMAA